MMKKLRGRNLKHPGCLIGITLGMIIGIVLAGVLASVFNVAMTIDMWVWFGIMFVLGAIGWIIGDRLSSRFPALEDETSATTQSDLPQSS
jgi:MFS family permease